MKISVEDLNTLKEVTSCVLKGMFCWMVLGAFGKLFYQKSKDVIDICTYHSTTYLLVNKK